jgi:manganese-dependent ADP-ribose/CDP-alcohol diphosphatase
MFPKDLPPVEPDLIAYYAFRPCKGVRIIVLDTYDISYLGWPVHHPHHKIARKILESRNPNARIGVPDSPVGLSGVDRRFVRFNGGVSYEQLRFLDDILYECDRINEVAIIWSHVPLHPDACDPIAAVWNFEDVLHILRKHRSAQVCLSGHDHTGGHAIDDHTGITYITLPGILVTPPGRDCFARMDIYEHGMRIVGVDMMKSYEIEWTHRPKDEAGNG